MSKSFYDKAGNVKFSENQFKILREVVKERGSAKVTLRTALRHYSGKNAAKDGLKSLQGKGVIEHHKEGVWLVKNLPEELHNRWLSD